MALVHISTARFVALLVLSISFVVGGVSAYAYLPKATVTLIPAREMREIQQEMLLRATQTEPDFAKFVLPAETVEVSVTEEVTVEREGVGREEKATGTVRLINNLDTEQQLLPNTHLRHEESGVFFLTDTPIAIPPEESRLMTVTAKEPGATGEVKAGKFLIEKLPADTQRFVFAESDQIFSGGLVIEEPITEDEISRALDEAREVATLRARGELTARVGGAVLRDDLVLVQEEERLASANPGDTARRYTAKSTVTVRAMRVDDKALLGLVALAAQSAGNSGEKFISYDPESFKIEILQSDFDRQEARILAKIRANFAPKLDPEAFDPKPLFGRSPQEVSEYLQNIDGVAEAEVDLSPFWVTAVPSRPGSVQVLAESVENN